MIIRRATGQTGTAIQSTLAFAILALASHATVTLAGESGTVSDGQLNYMLQCQGCHRANGEGIEGQIPDMRVYGKQLLLTPKGREYYVAVPGSANSPLSDRELAEVLNYIIANLLGNPNGQPVARYTENEVSRYRSVRFSDVEGVRAQLIDRIEN